MEPNLEDRQQDGIAQPEQITNIAEGAPTESNPTLESNIPQNIPIKKSSKTGIILGFIFLFLMAIGGVGFGIWAMIDRNSQGQGPNTQAESSSQEDKDSANDNNENNTNNTTPTDLTNIDNELAQTIIKPYLKTFRTLNNVFDYDFDEDTKAYLAYLNIERMDSYPSDRISYPTLNAMYKYLFGNDKNMERRNYSGTGKWCKGDLIYSDDGYDGTFTIDGGGCGGTMMAMFSIVKSAHKDGEKIIIDVYHDVVGVKAACETNGADISYCIDTDKSIVITESIEEYNMRDLIETHKDTIPIYRMTFTPDNGHYVLDLIERI